VLHPKPHVDTKFVDGKGLSAPGGHRDARPVTRTALAGVNCGRTLSATAAVSAGCRVSASHQEGFCWPLRLQQFGVPGAAGDKPGLHS